MKVTVLTKIAALEQETDQDTLGKGMDPRIRIRTSTKMSRIRNTVGKNCTIGCGVILLMLSDAEKVLRSNPAQDLTKLANFKLHIRQKCLLFGVRLTIEKLVNKITAE